MQYFTIFKTNCIHSIFRTIEARVDFNQRNRSKNFQNHLYGQPVLTFDKRQICEEILKELRFNVIKNLLSLFSFFISIGNSMISGDIWHKYHE